MLPRLLLSFALACNASQDPKSAPTRLKKLKEEVKYTPRLNPVPDDVDTLAAGDDLPPVPQYKVRFVFCGCDGGIITRGGYGKCGQVWTCTSLNSGPTTPGMLLGSEVGGPAAQVRGICAAGGAVRVAHCLHRWCNGHLHPEVQVRINCSEMETRSYLLQLQLQRCPCSNSRMWGTMLALS
jgi:hypothetical protein